MTVSLHVDQHVRMYMYVYEYYVHVLSQYSYGRRTRLHTSMDTAPVSYTCVLEYLRGILVLEYDELDHPADT